MPDDVNDAIEKNARGPQSAKGDPGSPRLRGIGVGKVHQHSLKDRTCQIAGRLTLIATWPRRRPDTSRRRRCVSPSSFHPERDPALLKLRRARA